MTWAEFKALKAGVTEARIQIEAQAIRVYRARSQRNPCYSPLINHNWEALRPKVFEIEKALESFEPDFRNAEITARSGQ
jgi:hypothetical protein